MKNRIEYIDQAKGFSIALVVLGHIWVENPIKIWFYAFHVPVFFIITGVLFGIKKKNIIISEFIKKQIKHLMIPYIIFEIIYCLVYTSTHGMDISVLRWNVIDAITFHTRASAGWFLLCLFISEIMFFFILNYIKNKKFQLLLIVILFLSPFFYEVTNYYIVLIERSFIALGFIYFGYSFADWINSFKANKYVLFVCIVVSGIVANLNGLTGMYSMYFHIVPVWIFNALFGSLSVILFFKAFNKKLKILDFWGENSLIILGIHGSLLEVLNIIMVRDNWLLGILKWIIVMTIMSIIIAIRKFITSRKKNENSR